MAKSDSQPTAPAAPAAPTHPARATARSTPTMTALPSPPASGRCDILGFGTALPLRSIDQAGVAALTHHFRGTPPHERRQADWVFRHAGVQRRYLTILDDDTTDPLHNCAFLASAPGPAGPSTADRMAQFAAQAPGLALRACRQALANAGLQPTAITHLIIVTCTGFAAPGVDLALMQTLGLAPTVERVQVGFMGCHGAINGLRVARGLALADPGSTVLLCAVELCSLHFQAHAGGDATVANALFGDGAAAAILRAESAAPRAMAAPAAPVRGIEPRRALPAGRLRLIATGSCLIPHTAEAMQWTVGDHGFVMHLAPEVPARIAGALRPWLDAFLAQHRWRRTPDLHWAVHPGGPRVLQAVDLALALPRDALAASRAELADGGNRSSPTIFFILQRLLAASARGPCVALAFGPGLVAEAALLELTGD